MMEDSKCLRCGESCEAVTLRPCDKCDDGSQIYYWPCGACGNDANGAQCEKKEDCAGAIEYRNANR